LVFHINSRINLFKRITIIANMLKKKEKKEKEKIKNWN